MEYITHVETNKRTRFWTFIRYIRYAMSFLCLNMQKKTGKQQKKYTVAVCAIFKNESVFLEWPVQFGQLPAYKDCFQKAKDETRWIAYIDLDEFICLRREQNIRNWIQKYDKYPTVYVNWKQFGTSGRLQHDDSQLVIEQYTACWPHPVNSGKSFVNTSYTFHRFECHMFYPDVRFLGIKTTILPVNEFKKFIHYWIMRSPRKGESEIQINHYYNRSYAQYLYKTLHRGDACSADSQKGREKQGLFEWTETLNTSRDYTIQRFLLLLKLRMQ